VRITTLSRTPILAVRNFPLPKYGASRIEARYPEGCARGRHRVSLADRIATADVDHNIVGSDRYPMIVTFE